MSLHATLVLAMFTSCWWCSWSPNGSRCQKRPVCVCAHGSVSRVFHRKEVCVCVCERQKQGFLECLNESSCPRDESLPNILPIKPSPIKICVRWIEVDFPGPFAPRLRRDWKRVWACDTFPPIWALTSPSSKLWEGEPKNVIDRLSHTSWGARYSGDLAP